MSKLESKLKAARNEASYFQGWLYNSQQVGASGELEKIASLKRIIGELSKAVGEEKAEVQWLKLQPTYEHQAMKDAEAESEVLRK